MLPTSLVILNLEGGNLYDGETPHKFTGGIPPEWGALANLKELNMANCSLDGKLLSTRAERFNGTLTLFLGMRAHRPSFK